jgi:hypothetical protein
MFKERIKTMNYKLLKVRGYYWNYKLLKVNDLLKSKGYRKNYSGD